MWIFLTIVLAGTTCYLAVLWWAVRKVNKALVEFIMDNDSFGLTNERIRPYMKREVEKIVTALFEKRKKDE